MDMGRICDQLFIRCDKRHFGMLRQSLLIIFYWNDSLIYQNRSKRFVYDYVISVELSMQSNTLRQYPAIYFDVRRTFGQYYIWQSSR